MNHLHYHVCSKEKVFSTDGKLLAEKIEVDGKPLKETDTFAIYKVLHLHCDAFQIVMKTPLDQLA